MKKLHPIMFAGTGSDVGKSVVTAGFCRIFKQDGYSPAPFKAQNMALNSYATPDGLEIGRAQAVQAEAAGLSPHTDMNPLLLKPQTDKTCQVVLNGRPIGNRDAYSYFNPKGRDVLRKEVNAAFDRLNSRYNPVVMEGAGSISEINLRETDLVNMPMAMYAGADIILVADIDRGGVFASVYGSVMLQRPEERKRIKGILINKFRGDLRLFQPGVKMIEDLCGVPVIGVLPYFKDIFVEEEDNMQLATKARHAAGNGKVSVAVALLRHISNFTDFNKIERDSRVNLYYADSAEDISKADIIIIPGSKSTIADLGYLRKSGMAQAIIKAAEIGKTVVGICGGYQMMGTMISDPEGIEGSISCMPGLGLLPMHTVMNKEKTTTQVRFGLNGDNSCDMEGYEIHNGRTEADNGSDIKPLCIKEDGTQDGCMAGERCMGTYIHGILDNSRFIDYLLHPYTQTEHSKSETDNWKRFKDEQYDKLAELIRSNVDMKLVYEILQNDNDD